MEHQSLAEPYIYLIFESFLQLLLATHFLKHVFEIIFHSYDTFALPNTKIISCFKTALNFRSLIFSMVQSHSLNFEISRLFLDLKRIYGISSLQQTQILLSNFFFRSTISFLFLTAGLFRVKRFFIFSTAYEQLKVNNQRSYFPA